MRRLIASVQSSPSGLTASTTTWRSSSRVQGPVVRSTMWSTPSLARPSHQSANCWAVSSAPRRLLSVTSMLVGSRSARSDGGGRRACVAGSRHRPGCRRGCTRRRSARRVAGCGVRPCRRGLGDDQGAQFGSRPVSAMRRVSGDASAPTATGGPKRPSRGGFGASCTGAANWRAASTRSVSAS